MLGKLKPNLQQNLFKTRLTARIKIYSLYEPQVACIAKGKSGKAYEFGKKVAVVRGRKTGIIPSVNGWRLMALLAGIGSNLKMRLNPIKPQILLWLELVLRLFYSNLIFNGLPTPLPRQILKNLSVGRQMRHLFRTNFFLNGIALKLFVLMLHH
jgi:hypothetical protein